MPSTIWKEFEPVTPSNPNGHAYEKSQTIQLANGNFLIAWQTPHGAGAGISDGYDIVGQIYDRFGNVVGGDFLLNSNHDGDDEQEFQITANSDGGFSAVYADIAELGSGYDLVFTHFNDVGGIDYSTKLVTDPDGQNTGSGNPVRNVRIAEDANSGDVFVTWESYTPATNVVQIVSAEVNAIAGSVATTSAISTRFYGGADSDGYDSHSVATLSGGMRAVAFIEKNNTSNDSVQFAVLDNTGNFPSGTQPFVVAEPSLGDAEDVRATALSGNLVAVSYINQGEIFIHVYQTDGTFRGISTPGQDVSVYDIDAYGTGEFVYVYFEPIANEIRYGILENPSPGTTNIPGVDFGVIATGANIRVSGMTDLSIESLEDGRVSATWSLPNAAGEDAEVNAFIFDPRDESAGDLGPQYSDNIIIGQIDNDVLGDALATEIHAWGGDDTINYLNAPLTTIDGGDGFDTLFIDAASSVERLISPTSR